MGNSGCWPARTSANKRGASSVAACRRKIVTSGEKRNDRARSSKFCARRVYTFCTHRASTYMQHSAHTRSPSLEACKDKDTPGFTFFPCQVASQPAGAQRTLVSILSETHTHRLLLLFAYTCAKRRNNIMVCARLLNAAGVCQVQFSRAWCHFGHLFAFVSALILME
jgi:hypothetical protein